MTLAMLLQILSSYPHLQGSPITSLIRPRQAIHTGGYYVSCYRG